MVKKKKKKKLLRKKCTHSTQHKRKPERQAKQDAGPHAVIRLIKVCTRVLGGLRAALYKKNNKKN